MSVSFTITNPLKWHKVSPKTYYQNRLSDSDGDILRTFVPKLGLALKEEYGIIASGQSVRPPRFWQQMAKWQEDYPELDIHTSYESIRLYITPHKQKELSKIESDVQTALEFMKWSGSLQTTTLGERYFEGIQTLDELGGPEIKQLQRKNRHYHSIDTTLQNGSLLTFLLGKSRGFNILTTKNRIVQLKKDGEYFSVLFNNF